MIDKSLLRVSNTPISNFFLQGELKAIKQGLKYTEFDFKDGAKYKGYVNKDGHPEGVGIKIYPDGHKERGEWHADGIAKIT